MRKEPTIAYVCNSYTSEINVFGTFFFFKVRPIYTLPTLASENIRFVSEQVFKAAEGRLAGWPAGEGGGCEDPAGRSLLGAGRGVLPDPVLPTEKACSATSHPYPREQSLPTPGSLVCVQLGHRRRPPTAHILSRALGVPPLPPPATASAKATPPHFVPETQSRAGFAEPLGARRVPSLRGDMKESERGQSSRHTRIYGGTAEVPCLTHTPLLFQVHSPSPSGGLHSPAAFHCSQATCPGLPWARDGSGC